PRKPGRLHRRGLDRGVALPDRLERQTALARSALECDARGLLGHGSLGGPGLQAHRIQRAFLLMRLPAMRTAARFVAIAALAGCAWGYPSASGARAARRSRRPQSAVPSRGWGSRVAP